MLRTIVALRRVLTDTFGHFNDDDGWSMASHLAITALMALFPFLIFATTLASFLGANAFAETAVHLVFDTWPEQIAEPISREVVNVLTVQRSDLLTYGVLLAAFFASNGDRGAAHLAQPRLPGDGNADIICRRSRALLFVLIATIGFLAISLLMVLAPLIARLLVRNAEWIGPYIGTFSLWRYMIASAVIVLGLFAVHIWLPAGQAQIHRDRARNDLHADRLAGRLDDFRRHISTGSRPT